MGKNNSIMASCWRLPCRVLALVLAAAANGVVVAALRTVLDPNGLPLLRPATSGGLPYDDGSCMDTKPRGWGGLRQVDLIYLGSFVVQHSSTAIKWQSSLTPRSATADAYVPEELAEALFETPGGDKKTDGDEAAPPLLLLGGHVCTLSTEKYEKQPKINGGNFTLREPYAWESEADVAGFVLPRWMWDAVGGETGGGALLIHANTSWLEERDAPGRKTAPLPSADAAGIFEPFVQVALWGNGDYHPLFRVASTGVSLEGGGWGGDTGRGARKAIRTEAGDLEVSSAAGLHLLSGGEQGADVRIGATGERDGIYLSSDVLHWTSSSHFVNSSGSFERSTTGVGLDEAAKNRRGEEAAVPNRREAGATGRNGRGEGARQGAVGDYEASFTLDEDMLEARGLATVRLGAGRSFDLAVVDWPEGVADEPNGGAVRGDLESVNVSAGVVNVQGSDRVLVSGANGTRVTSAAGDVHLDASNGNASVRLSGTDIQGAAPTIIFSASAAPQTGTRAVSGKVDITAKFNGAEARTVRVVEGAGGYLNLTGKSAIIGGPGDASVEAGDEVRLRVNSSDLRVSKAAFSIRTPTILLHASSLRESTPTTVERSLIGKPSSSSKQPDEIQARVSLGGGILAMNASASLELETRGAFARLIGRGDSRSHEELGVFVADADAVKIKARSPAGVILTADTRAGVESEAGDIGTTTGVNVEDSTNGSRLEVSTTGVAMEGSFASVTASRRLTLRAGVQEGLTGQNGDPGGLKEKSGHPWPNMKPAGSGVSTIDLGDWGVQVVAPSSESVVLRAGSRIVLEAAELAISHVLGGEAVSEESSGDTHHKQTGGGEGVDGGGGGGGLWSDGITLTGRADRRVLLQAGPSNGGRTSKGDEIVTNRSHISIEEDWIHISVGGARELALAAAETEPAANKAGSSSGDGVALSGKGLSLEVVGVASLASTEDLKLRAQEVLVSSSNQTLVYSPGGVLLAGSPSLGSGSTDSAKMGSVLPGLVKQEGYILLAPGAGAGVGIGPVFSAQDLLAPIGFLPSLLYVTNSTRPASQRLRPPPDAHIAVESSGSSAVSVLSPRGKVAAVRFGCDGLPYSGGLAIRHHRDAASGDTLLLELADSPGRIVGDASGRWGLGAVPKSGLAATLHVFASPNLAELSRAGPTSSVVSEPTTAFLIESTGAGVMQLLSGTASASSPHSSVDNAIVLSSSPGRNEPTGHNHWVMSQLGGKAATSRPAWTDALTDRSSWAGGVAFTHVSGGGSTGWRSALETFPRSDEAGREKTAARPVLALGSNGQSGFGTGATGARVTVGGALVAEQVLVLSDEGMVRDVDQLGNQGREQAMEALRKVDVVSFGWTKEASASYGLRPDVRQLGVIAQQVKKQASQSLVWKDPIAGRMAVSYSKLLVTLVAAFQHLDGFVNAERKTWDDRLEGLEKAVASAAENTGNTFERLIIVEKSAEAGASVTKVHARDLTSLEGRLSEQGNQAQAVRTDLAALQRKAAEEKGNIQEWRMEGSRRAQELEKEVESLKSRFAILEERRKDDIEDQKLRQRAQNEQIQALSLRIGTSYASQSRCDSSLLAEVEALRTSQGELESRLAPLLLQQQLLAPQEEAFFLEEVQRLEDDIITAEVQRHKGRISVRTTTAENVAGGLAGATSSSNGDRHSWGGAPLLTAEIQQQLEKHKEAIREEAMSALLRRREHLNALRRTSL